MHSKQRMFMIIAKMTKKYVWCLKKMNHDYDVEGWDI